MEMNHPRRQSGIQPLRAQSPESYFLGFLDMVTKEVKSVGNPLGRVVDSREVASIIVAVDLANVRKPLQPVPGLF